jgi:hypothetical protein
MDWLSYIDLKKLNGSARRYVRALPLSRPAKGSRA